MTHETVPLNRRIYMVMQPMPNGMAQFRLSAMPPRYSEPTAVLLLRGVLPQGDDVVLQVVSDPAANVALRGLDGLSAYQLARQQGYGGTLTAWLASLVGAAGLSAYEIAREMGYGGTKTQWLASLNGKNASAILGPVTIAQTATVAISAGTRRMVVTIPASWGVVAGDPLIALPSITVAGYAVHDVVAVSATSLSIGITAPLLAIGASFSIPCRIARLNT
ncbi:hypothetical protein [Sphingomonas sp. CFBP 8764]|uniref:hypothetical protein n=1 Tax=Sphingomonas sp. CFBP 8764 TaxID=2775275 RepID=UPI0017858EAF|nr:hypothetical protein [Sphingomonas sp. CFBP 8764]MBD8549492.1 hypothetical protein [Sphingomonas sp. CFBP 8764]